MTERGAVPITAPWPMAWLGVTAEDNQRAEERILTLRATPAAVRFVSCEPVLEAIGADTWDLVLGPREGLGPIHWLIIGDESGRERRGANVDWIRTARDAAARHNVAFHFKQWCGGPANGIAQIVEVPNIFGGDPVMDRRPAGSDKIHLPILDGVQHANFPDRR